MSKANGKLRKYQDWAVFLHGDAFRGGWGFLGQWSGRGWGFIGGGYWIICCRCLGREGNGGVDEDARRGTITATRWSRNSTEAGAGDEVIMSIAGHVARAMLSRNSLVRMEAKRRALDEIAARQRAADKKRKKDAERRKQGAVVSQSAVVQ